MINLQFTGIFDIWWFLRALKLTFFFFSGEKTSPERLNYLPEITELVLQWASCPLLSLNSQVHLIQPPCCQSLQSPGPTQFPPVSPNSYMPQLAGRAHSCLLSLRSIKWTHMLCIGTMWHRQKLSAQDSPEHRRNTAMLPHPWPCVYTHITTTRHSLRNGEVVC